MRLLNAQQCQFAALCWAIWYRQIMHCQNLSTLVAISHWSNIPKVVLGQQQSLQFQFLVGYETMSNCSQNCWIDWNSAVLCFKWLFHIGVWTFARYVRLLLAAILCVWEIWSGSNNPVYMYHVFHCLAKKNKKQIIKNMSPHQFWSRSMTSNRRPFWGFNIGGI